jgi:hypothetical protein
MKRQYQRSNVNIKYGSIIWHIYSSNGGGGKETSCVLPEEVGHVSIGAVDSTKSRKQSHESHPNHTNPADELFYR